MGNGNDWQNQAGYQLTSTPQLYSAVSFKSYKMELMPLTVMLPL
ncbi:hypothetical protein [Lactococcus lactis]|nr:hypothetical protein [Lactococcus lactis]